MAEQNPAALDQASQILMELGRLQAENERLREELAGRQDGEETEKQIKARKRQALLDGPVCMLRWLKNPQQGRILVGDRVYKGRGPKRDRNTQRIVEPGSTFQAPVDDARHLDESGYAEIIEGRELVTNWTPAVVIPADAAPPPAAGDLDAWEGLAVYG